MGTGTGPGLRYFDLLLCWPRTSGRAGVQQAVAQCLGLGAGQGPIQAEQPERHSRSAAIMAATRQAWLISVDVATRTSSCSAPSATSRWTLTRPLLSFDPY